MTKRRRKRRKMTSAAHIRNIVRGMKRRGAKAAQCNDATVMLSRVALYQLPVCSYCKRIMKFMDVSMDHADPVSLGGSHELENLVICCKGCNRAKGQLDRKEYLLLLSLLKDNFRDGGKYILSRLKASGFAFKRK